MKRAYVLIRDKPHYRSESFIRGLRQNGYEAILMTGLTPAMIKSTHDIVIVWNAYGRYGDARGVADKAGCRTFVAENGYLGEDRQQRQFYALAEHGHTGSGRWRVGGSQRWEHLMATQNVCFAARRTKGKHILICGQRSIGEVKMRSPYGWEDDVQKEIRQTTDRPIKVRPHPGRHKDLGPLDEDLRNAWAVVVWSSNCTTEALLQGFPVFYSAPHIVHQGGALPLKGANLENPEFGNRLQSFINMSWAQWSVGELEKGTPWQFLLPEDNPAGTIWAGGYKK